MGYPDIVAFRVGHLRLGHSGTKSKVMVNVLFMATVMKLEAKLDLLMALAARSPTQGEREGGMPVL